MLEKLTVIELASAMARHAAARHRVLAQNVANADTPGYRARDVEDFSAMVNKPFTQRATRAEHFGASPATRAAEPPVIEADYPASPDGNSVNLEDQSLRAAETLGQHDLATAVYAKTVDILRIGLGRNR